MIVLALDTALAACQCALVGDGVALASISEGMVRGHQERLAAMVGEAMASAGLDFAAIDRIAVTLGPGSFTGLRIGLAFAKGLSMALSRPLVGVGSLVALAASVSGPYPRAAVIDAGRGRICLQVFDGAKGPEEPQNFAVDEAAERLRGLAAGRAGILIGPGAGLLQGALPAFAVAPITAPEPHAIAILALDESALRTATPLYLRAPDARPRVP